ncbi:hypothetical protein GP486_008657 [Trichoglossum hirsutum]|uniref:Uncharacterized protein n=1 Tax=Trichoglossum hirsutum TaxID=265104 RepID=A0A9P8L4T4_9PEZI|nr:hypothetical protein GP486_008657 [Trichoglossum hirsutum]
MDYSFSHPKLLLQAAQKVVRRIVVGIRMIIDDDKPLQALGGPYDGLERVAPDLRRLGGQLAQPQLDDGGEVVQQHGDGGDGHVQVRGEAQLDAADVQPVGVADGGGHQPDDGQVDRVPEEDVLGVQHVARLPVDQPVDAQDGRVHAERAALGEADLARPPGRPPAQRDSSRRQQEQPVDRQPQLERETQERRRWWACGSCPQAPHQLQHGALQESEQGNRAA